MSGQTGNIAEGVEKTFFSGAPGTTGREPFEDSTASGPAPQFAGDNNTSGVSSSQYGANTLPAGMDGDRGAGNPNITGTGMGDRDPTGTGAGSGGYTGGEGHHHHHHHHHHEGQQGAGGVGFANIEGAGQGTTGDSYGANSGGMTTGTTGGSSGGQYDRVGKLGQDQALYERTTDQGPQTTGAAGTDRFDTDRSGVQGDSYGARDQYPDERSGEDVNPPKSGGLMGVLGTSDKDFVNRDRLGSGAYADTEGAFQSNKSGPGGNTALTGREGNVQRNPVAQATGGDRVTEDDVGVGGTSGKIGDTGGVYNTVGNEHEGQLDADGNPPKKGFTEKVKEMFSA